MRLFIKILVSLLIISFVVIQFFQPEKNISTDSQNIVLNHPDFPENIQQILINTCLDCHSNNTRYPWYDRISPVSWMISKHIKKGKKELNFSKWGEMDKYDKITALEDIRQELEQKTMPLKSYSLIHKKARLSDENRSLMLDWIDKTGSELVKKSVEK